MADQNDSKNGSDGKVVEFPLHRIRKSGEPAAKKDGESNDGAPAAAKTPEQKRRALVVSMLSAFVAAMFLSHHSGVNRAPQSIDARPSLASDIKTAAQLNQQSLREPASGGRTPSLEDQLRFGLLKNRYELNLSTEGALRGVTFDAKSGGHLVQVGNREKLIKKYGELFLIPFDDIQGPSRFHDAKHAYEIFMLSHNSQAVARVTFVLSNGDTLNAMSVDPQKSE